MAYFIGWGLVFAAFWCVAVVLLCLLMKAATTMEREQAAACSCNDWEPFAEWQGPFRTDCPIHGVLCNTEDVNDEIHPVRLGERDNG